ncbi:hypothetical protein [Streptomyces camelliae]|uniref:Uncharacterized protein n=1 Tax=Streptomyces camelliae TaxID=3004093 RepID=A0ABY7P193_9ACTN|nr:hypothetical protein [Streptomyces sp. HUAS 2-6]WBO64276.1 hypothetical protein O1G22_16275 [Streptomyces sp. HUAS 2-6]
MAGRRAWWGRRAAVWLACLVPVLGAAGAGSVSAAPGQGGDEPDLALVVTGDAGRTRALRSGEPDFTRLRELLRPDLTGTERVPQAWSDGRYPAVQVTVLWGLTGVGGWPQTHRAPGGDVAVERQDQLFVAADGTAWVRSDPSPEVVDDDIRWHQVPAAVFREAERTGLLGSAVASGPGAPDRVPDGVWWAVAGLVAGAGGGLLVGRGVARRGAGPPHGDEPRQELIDR